jgi:hypothetical protein
MADDGLTHVEGNIVFPCCNDPENLDREERLSPSLVVRYCRVCGRRHFEATADPLQLGLRGASL